jgi:hypothetical protein
MDRNRRTVVEIRQDLHQEIRKLALLNDLRTYELANTIIEEALGDHEKMKLVINKTRLRRLHASITR